MNRWGVLILGVGVGVTVGARVGQPATLPALVIVVVGLLLLIFGGRPGKRDIVAEAIVARTGTPRSDKASRDASDRPSLQGLGSQVERVLRIAEEQAADHIAEAKATAARIVADAQAEAQRMKPE